MYISYRQIERRDLGLLRDWRNLDEIRIRTREYRLLNMTNQEDWFENISRDRTNEMYLISIDFIPVGVCGLCHIDWVNRNAEVSIYIGAEYARRGGTGTAALKMLERKAFDEFNLHKIYAEIFSNNMPSMELFKKCGYIEEGRLKEQVFKGGQYLDSVFFSLYKES